ncbi:glycosyltransferase [Microbacterium sp.]|jgi:cellulose synthase/poly-beta-1,6-N-acetylglucosamine synthase-like glycosyltransferase|uniref:glycosyltransferase n=1 Tax=Microbacterium sp. TaxID=51671 RepID=UPI0037C5A597
MFIFLLQVRHMLEGYPELYLFAVYSFLIWGLWLTKLLISQHYRPFTEPHEATTSVIIPVVDEPLDLFRDVLGRIIEQEPDEIIVVINGARNLGLEEVCAEFAPKVRWVHTPIAGKRNAVKVGVELSTYEISVLVDSDTVWTPGTLEELVKPFGDKRVGGATTRQRILEPERSWITRWADWLENTRSLYSMPAQSVLGQVGCLPGRTIAFRRDILVRVMDKFMNEKFMGVFLEISDDRTLTNLTLKEGYRTVYQHTSLVYTDAPTQVKKLYKQQLRWARGSQYNTLRMLPWMLGHAPLLAVFMVMDIVLPFLLAGVIGGWIYRAAVGEGHNFYVAILNEFGMSSGLIWVVALIVISSVLSMAIRQLRHLAERPSDFLRLPIFIITSTAFLMPIRLIGFFRMGHASGWGTRAGAYAGGDAPTTDEQATGRDIESERMHQELAKLGIEPAGTDASPARPSTNHAAGPGTVAYGPLRRGEQGVAVAESPTRVALRQDRTRATTEQAEVAPTPTASAQASDVQTAPPRRRLNPKAAWPYVIGLAIFALEAIFIV